MTGVIVWLIGMGIVEGITGRCYYLMWPVQLGKFIKEKGGANGEG